MVSVSCAYHVTPFTIYTHTHRGTFLLERGDKSSFEVRVPPFTLDSSRDDEQS